MRDAYALFRIYLRANPLSVALQLTFQTIRSTRNSK
jgi:hypothetical protein